MIMKIDLLDIDKFVKEGDLVPISDPIIFNKGFEINPHGLLSREIFGTDSKTRKTTYAYIDLGGRFLSPIVYKVLIRLNRSFLYLINGTKKFIVTEKGDLLEDEEKGGSGLDYLYKIWDKINFKKNESIIRGERVDLLTIYPKNRLFTNKLLVIPAFYRDVNVSKLNGETKVAPHIITDTYSKIIRASVTLKFGNDFAFMTENSQLSMQMLLIDLYELLKGTIAKKHGMIRQNLMGKVVDYSSSMVITTPTFDVNKVEDMSVDYYRAGIPLSQCMSMFYPFIINGLTTFFDNEFNNNNSISDGEKNIELGDTRKYFNVTEYEKRIKMFMNAPSTRFDKVQIPIGDGKMVDMKIVGYQWINNEKNVLVNRPATWTDIFYLVTHKVCKDKMVVITRYPVLDQFSSFFQRVEVLSTQNTMKVIINENEYPRFPIVDLEAEPDTINLLFSDTVCFSNLYLSGIGGDYDGDKVAIKSLYTQEAIAEAEEKMRSKANFVDIKGDCRRDVTNEAIQALYCLTKE